MRISDLSSDVCSSDLTPVPYQLCYCSICRKQQGGGGYAINLGADARSLMIEGEEHLGLYRARIEDGEHPTCRLSSGERHFCRLCGSALRSEEHTSELQSLMRTSYAVFCLKKKK